MKSKLICVAMIALAISSCNKGATERKKLLTDNSNIEVTQAAAGEGNDDQVPVGTQLADTVATPATPPVAKPAAKVEWDKQIIKTATVKLEVKSFKNYNEGLRKKIKQYGGYIAGEDNFFTEEKSEIQVTVKVPVAQFESLMDELAGTDTKIIERSIKTEDVTGEVVDTKSRLEAKKQMRLKYLDFLKQSKNMTEVLQVQEEINSIQEQIESAAGRIQYLSNQSAYSTINLSFYEPKPGFEPVNTKPSFFTQAAEGFKTGTDFIRSLVLGLITIWPLLIIGFTGLYFWRRKRPAKTIQPNQNV